MGGRRWLLGCLVAVFLVQTWLVYSDTIGRRTPPLSAQAAEGQRLWRRHNCQSCHQIYGFGGFLGPDLTNAAATLTEARVDLILTAGSGLMPAFGLPAENRAALLRFLTELDRTGVSQPRLQPRRPTAELLDHLVATVTGRGEPLTDLEAAGLEILRREKCIACHLPNFDTPVRAPDLTTVLDRRGEEQVLAVLAAGVPGKVMPKFAFSPRQQSGVIASLLWLGDHGEQAARVFEVTRPGGWSLSSIPWFEYE